MSTFSIIGFVLLVLNSLIGMVANGYIILFIGIDWIRSRKLSPTNVILFCLGLSRFSWQTVVTLHIITDSFFQHVYSQNYMWTVINTMWFFISNMNLWFAAWLSVLYFVKVAIFSHPVFLLMKQRIPGLVPWLLLGSLVFSAAATVTVITFAIIIFSDCPFYPTLSSYSNDSAVQNLNFCRFSAVLLIAPSIIPFMLFLSSTIFLICSLWKHIRSLQCNGTGTKDLSTQVHLTAIKVLVSFAVLYLSSFVAASWETVITAGQHYERSWATIIFEYVTGMYPSGHAIILILINPKLKQGFIRMLYHFRCCLSKAPS